MVNPAPQTSPWGAAHPGRHADSGQHKPSSRQHHTAHAMLPPPATYCSAAFDTASTTRLWGHSKYTKHKHRSCMPQHCDGKSCPTGGRLPSSGDHARPAASTHKQEGKPDHPTTNTCKLHTPTQLHTHGPRPVLNCSTAVSPTYRTHTAHNSQAAAKHELQRQGCHLPAHPLEMEQSRRRTYAPWRSILRLWELAS